MKKLLLLLLVTMFWRQGIAQTGNLTDWAELEKQVKERRLLDQAASQLDSIFFMAYRAKDYLATARAGFLRMQIKDLRTEDTLFFINQSTFDSLISDPKTPVQLQFCIHLILAKRLETFNTIYKKFPVSRYRVKEYQSPYPYLDKQQTDSLIEDHYERALQLAPIMGAYPVIAGLWLSNNPAQFLVKPIWGDIVLSNQASYLSRTGINSRELFGEQNDWIDWTPQQMAEQIDSLIKKKAEGAAAFSIYRRWLRLHGEAAEPSAYINLLLKQAMFYEQEYLGGKSLRNRYISFLKTELQNEEAGVRAYALYHIFYLLVKAGNLYAPGERNYYASYSADTQGREFIPAYRYLIDSAVAMVDKQEALLDSFPLVKNLLKKAVTATKVSQAEIRLQQYQLPGKSILCEVRFRNVDSMRLKIWKAPYYAEHSSVNDTLLKRCLLIQSRDMKLPAANDLNEHITYINLAGLSTGKYILEYWENNATETKSKAYIVFTVTTLTVTVADDWLLVFDKITGRPVRDAIVLSLGRLQGTTERGPSMSGKSYKTNGKGVVQINDKDFRNLLIIRGNDSVIVSMGSHSDYLTPDIYDKEEYDNLTEYYYENTEVFFYTDRSIYRPGQIVQYKAFFFTRNPKTGEYLLLTAKNLRKGAFKNYLKKLLKEEDPFLYLEDAHGHDIDSVRISPDEWGAMSGKFHLPVTAATGEWSFYTDFFNDKTNTFLVEEYKRPGFEVKLINPRQELLPGMPFEFKIEATGYSGVPMAGIKLICNLRSGGKGQIKSSGEFIDVPEYRDSLVVFTNAKGQAKIYVNDSLAKQILNQELDMLDINYRLWVRAVTPGGEVQDERTGFGVTLHPVSVKWMGEQIWDGNKERTIKWQFNHSIAGILSRPARIIIRSANPGIHPKSNLFFPADLSDDTTLLRDVTVSLSKEDSNAILLDTLLPATASSFTLPFNLRTGHYTINISAIQDRRSIGEIEKKVTVFEDGDKGLGGFDLFHIAPRLYKSGDTVAIVINNAESDQALLLRIIYRDKKRRNQTINEFYALSGGYGVRVFKWKIPAGVESEALIQKFSLEDGVLSGMEKRISVYGGQDNRIDIKVDRFRKLLQPGAKEEWNVQLTANGKPASGQLMTVLYDASLDKLNEHNWQPPSIDKVKRLYSDFRASDNNLVSGRLTFYKKYLRGAVKSEKSSMLPFWWMASIPDQDSVQNLFSIEISDPYSISQQLVFSEEIFLAGGWGPRQLLGRVSGVQVTGTNDLSELVVTGLSVSRKAVTSAMSIIQGTVISLSSYAQPLVILDGVPFTGNLDSLNRVASVQGLLVGPGKGDALFGASGSKGVLILSTKGPIVLPEPTVIQPEVVANMLAVRKNFRETGFFMSALVSDKKGMINIPFEMPESLTRWNWKMLAHDKKLRFGYGEEKVYTSLPLMIQPHLPAYIHAGDSIWMSARVTSLDSFPSKATVRIMLEDPVTGQSLNNMLKQADTLQLYLDAGGSATAGFWIKDPANGTTRFIVKMYAGTASFTDGEQHEIVILPRYQLRQISEDRRLLASEGQVLLPFPEKLKPFGASFTVPVQPVSALLKHLRYLLTYPFDCAEQLSNKLLGDLIAIRSVKSNKTVQASYARATSQIMTGGNAIQQADVLWSGTTPWLDAREKNLTEQRETFALLDSNRALNRITANWKKLQALQVNTGGLSWFPDMPADYHISVYVAGVLARMIRDSLLVPGMINSLDVQQFTQKLSNYIVYDRAAEEYIRSTKGFLNVIYVLSQLGTISKADSLHASWRERIIRIWPDAYKLPLPQQARLIAATLRLPAMDHLLQTVDSLLQSIMQLSITDDKGMRWKDIANNTGMSESAEELLYLLNDAISIRGSFANERRQIARWILQTREGEIWSSTMAVSAAASLLQLNGEALIMPSQTAQVRISSREIELTNDPLRGMSTGYFPLAGLQTQIKVEAKSDSPVSLTTTWHYCDSTGEGWGDKGVTLQKKYMIKHQGQGEWKTWTYGQALQTGDELNVRLLIGTDRELRYVVIEDERAAAFSPVDVYSGQEYGTRFSAYKTIRDATTQFFVASMPEGSSYIDYTVKVEHTGLFKDGAAILRCLYEPSVGAGSGSGNVYVEK